MDTVLVVITLISAMTAIVAVAVAWRLRRHDRERSDARVAALASAAETHGARDGGWTAVSGEWQWNPEPVGMRANPESQRNPRRRAADLLERLLRYRSA